MQVLVHGKDGPEFEYGPSDLHEAHQAYMDGWSSALVARGPTLSSDGEVHTGSVHVVDVEDLEAARRFAFDEPYARAGWYASVAVLPMLSCVAGTMWDRPLPAPEQTSAFVTAGWPTVISRGALADVLRAELARDEGPPWLFVGLLLTDDLNGVCGVAGALDLAPTDAYQRLARVLDRMPVLSPVADAQRWMRGGRSTD